MPTINCEYPQIAIYVTVCKLDTWDIFHVISCIIQ